MTGTLLFYKICCLIKFVRSLIKFNKLKNVLFLYIIRQYVDLSIFIYVVAVKTILYRQKFLHRSVLW